MRYKQEYVFCRDLKTDSSYQREINLTHLNKIIKGFDIDQIRILTVSRRPNNELFVIDGNHTRTAAMKVMGENAQLLANVYDDLTPQQEAILFNKLNTNSKVPTYNDNMKAKYAGNDRQTVAYINALNVSGLAWNFSKGSGKQKMFTAHRAGLRKYEEYGSDIFIDACRALNTVIDPGLCTGKVLGGICYILSRTSLKKADIENTFKKITQIELENNIKAYKGTALYNGNSNTGHDYVFARGILDFYNKGKRAKNRIYIDPPNGREV